MEIIQPEVQGTGETPLIVITPHSSTYITKEFQSSLAISESEVRRFTDMYTDELFGEVVNLGGVLIPGSVSRFVVQLNKKTEVRDGRLYVWDKKLTDIVDADPKNPDSSFIRYSWTGNKIMEPEMTEREMMEIYEAVYQPFFAAIDKAVAEAQEKFGYSVLIDGHSFPSVSADGERKHADFVLGTRDWTTADVDLIYRAVHALLERASKVGIDMYEWNGGYTTAHYSRMAGKRKGFDPKKANALQIETNKNKYMDEKTFKKSSDFAKTKDHISYWLEEVESKIISIKN